MTVLTAAALLLAACGGGDDAPTATATPVAVAKAVESVQSSDPMAFPTVVPLEVPLKAPSEVPEEMKAIWEVWALLTREHVDRSKLDLSEFTEAAIRGMLTALDDTHTVYLSEEAFLLEDQDLQGEFEGIGANVQMRPGGKLIIVAPLAGSPAEDAGIRPGDIILEVDGESIEGLNLLEAVAKIRGPRGSQVMLLILHLGALDAVEIMVTRDVIPLTSVLLRSDPGDRIAHIRITDFNANTADTLAETIRDAVATGTEGLIIDVRNNPGGLLTSAIDVTSLFLDRGMILYEVDGKGERKELNANRGGVAIDIPLVVLANEFSASASEIFVGALQDHKRATVVGATTFGKGSVGILRRLSNGGGLVVTIARFYTPDGRLIEGEGLSPDIEVVSRDRQEEDVSQLERAIEEVESMIQLNQDSGA